MLNQPVCAEARRNRMSAINGVSEGFFNTSLLRSMGRSFPLLLPLWWFFESLNKIVKNWHYVFAYPISNTL